MDDYSQRFLEESCLVSTSDKEGNIVYVNDFFCNYTGYSRREIIGKNYRMLKSGQHSDDFFKRLWDEIARGKTWRGHLRNKTKNGVLYWVDTHIFPKLDETGRPVEFAAYQIPFPPEASPNTNGDEGAAAGHHEGGRLDLYHSLVDNLPLSIWRKDRQGKITFVNKALLEKMKVPASALVGKTNYDLYPKELADKYRKDDERVMTEGVTYHDVEDNIDLVTGSHLYIETIKIPVRGEDGNIEGLQGVFWDITEAVVASQKLAKSQRYHKKLVDKINEIILLVDSSGQITYSSESVKSIAGYTPEEMLDMKLADMIEPADRPAVDEFLKNARSNSSRDMRLELKVLTKSGPWQWMETTIANYSDDDDIGALVVNMRNIHEQRSAAEKIRYHANLLEEVSDAIISTDHDFRIVSWNRAAEVIYGWLADEVIGKRVLEVLPTQYTSQGEEEVIGEYTKNGFWEGEVIQKTKDGKDIHMFGSISAIRDDEGRPTGSIAVNRNITESKEAEKKLRLQNEQLAEIAWLHSHKIRGPVATIMGLMNIFDWQQPDSPQNLNVIKKVDLVSKQLDMIIHDVVKKTGELYDESD